MFEVKKDEVESKKAEEPRELGTLYPGTKVSQSRKKVIALQEGTENKTVEDEDIITNTIGILGATIIYVFVF